MIVALLAVLGCSGDPPPAEPVGTEAPAGVDPGPFAAVWGALDPMSDEKAFQQALDAFRADSAGACPRLVARAAASRDTFDRSLRAVSALRCPGAVDTTVELWRHSALDASRWEAAFVLAVLPEEAALAALRDGALKGDETTRRSALVALGRRQDPAECPLLLEAATSESPGVRVSAITGAWDALCLDDAALAGFANDKDPEVVDLVARLRMGLQGGVRQPVEVVPAPAPPEK